MNKMESNALREVLEWKDKAYQEVAHLDVKKALQKRIYDSVETTRKLKLQTITTVHR